MLADLLSALAEQVRAADTRTFWLVWGLLASLDVILLALGLRRLHRVRLLGDLPTARMRSAAQGYVELEGRARMMPGDPVFAPLTQQPCAWYSYRIEERERDSQGRSQGWRTLESGVSEAIFHLEDGTGSCIVDPDGAEVIPAVHLCWRGHNSRPSGPPRDTGFWAKVLETGSYRYTESCIRDNDSLYAVGQFVGSGDRDVMSLNDAVRDILAGWKRDRVSLLRRFDADGDGEIDLAEWETARAAAEQEALTHHMQRHAHPEQNVLKKPPYGQPFLLSCIPQDALIKRFRTHGGLLLLAFLLLGASLTWALDLRV